MLERHARARHLARIGAAAQLVGQFKTLCQAGGAERMAFREQAARRIGDDLAAIGVVAIGDEGCGLAFGAQAQCLVADQLILCEAVVKFDQVEVG